MSKSTPSCETAPEEIETLEIDLRDPYLAGFLAWLIPGAGHIYQRRFGKGILFFVCIMGTFLYGLVVLGEGRVVYASWTQEDKRWPYPCQLGAGLVATPAIVQNWRVRHNEPPNNNPLWGDYMAPPSPEELNQLQAKLATRFDLGTTYTMIAGLLNILAIYDACAGPLLILPRRKEEKSDSDQKESGRNKKDKKSRDGPKSGGSKESTDSTAEKQKSPGGAS